MKKPFESGDKVTHKGHTWTVVYCDSGLVKIKREGDELVVRQNQVRAYDSWSFEEQGP